MPPEAPRPDDGFTAGVILTLVVTMIAAFAVWALWMALR